MHDVLPFYSSIDQCINRQLMVPYELQKLMAPYELQQLMAPYEVQCLSVAGIFN